MQGRVGVGGETSPGLGDLAWRLGALGVDGVGGLSHGVRFQNGVWAFVGVRRLVGRLFAIPGLLANGFQPSDIVCDATGSDDSMIHIPFST
jgi:hypothetical protein